MRRSRSRWSVCTVDSEERGPTVVVAGSGLSGTVGRIAAPLRGRRSRREDGRLSARAGAARPAGAGIDGPRGWLHLKSAFACSSSKQHALLEQMTVQGALCSKASCVVLVEASRVAGERSCGPDHRRGAQCELHERCYSRPPQLYRDRRMSFPPRLARAASRCAWSGAASSTES